VPRFAGGLQARRNELHSLLQFDIESKLGGP
jgi:hypothetical protein